MTTQSIEVNKGVFYKQYCVYAHLGAAIEAVIGRAVAQMFDMREIPQLKREGGRVVRGGTISWLLGYLSIYGCMRYKTGRREMVLHLL